MANQITIALDCMGGDNAPLIVLRGAEAIATNKEHTNNVKFLLFGDSARIQPILANCPSLAKICVFTHTPDVITADEKPSVALRKGTKSSMRLAIDAVKNGEADVAVSAGNTGALMAISKVILRPLDGIDRPAIVTAIPNRKQKATVLLDMGANVECDANVLYQFAIMGHAFAKAVMRLEDPTVGILNIGSEELKGNEAVKNAAAILKESHLKNVFHGYVEGDDITKGTVDVVVTDGFSGNITLKAIEGTAKMMVGTVKDAFTNSFLAKIGYIFCVLSIKKAFKRMDPRLHNGAMLVGLNGVVVKSHGGTDAIGFANSIKVAISLVENKINEQIMHELKSSSDLQAQNSNSSCNQL